MGLVRKKKHEEIEAFLGKGAEFSGKLIFSGYVRVDGSFSGEIFGEGTLAVGEGAQIKGEIQVGNALISGEVEGNIAVRDKLKIYRTGKIWGAIKTPVLSIEEGAFFEGTSCMESLGDVKVEEEEERAYIPFVKP